MFSSAHPIPLPEYRARGPEKDGCQKHALHPMHLAGFDGKSVKFLDIGAKFLDKEGRPAKENYRDMLHLSAKGYGIWGEAIEPVVGEMMKE